MYRKCQKLVERTRALAEQRQREKIEQERSEFVGFLFEQLRENLSSSERDQLKDEAHAFLEANRNDASSNQLLTFESLLSKLKCGDNTEKFSSAAQARFFHNDDQDILNKERSFVLNSFCFRLAEYGSDNEEGEILSDPPSPMHDD